MSSSVASKDKPALTASVRRPHCKCFSPSSPCSLSCDDPDWERTSAPLCWRGRRQGPFPCRSLLSHNRMDRRRLPCHRRRSLVGKRRMGTPSLGHWNLHKQHRDSVVKGLCIRRNITVSVPRKTPVLRAESLGKLSLQNRISLEGTGRENGLKKAISLLRGPPARAITAPLKGAILQACPLAIGQWLVRWYGFPLSRTGT